ncbi:MAG: serine/threonine protein kinase [Chitinispirillaceae bacterium]|nr:serine/threonine protein kinase [Chitinispirillaceae bacterium]
MSTGTTQSTPKAPSGSAPVKEQMLQEGDLLGHCRVRELIAAGGMANVYKVWHEQLEVVRAIKILKPGFSDEARGRLETEAKISANLRHTNIVEIYGMGYWNDIPYIEMEYIDGPSLKDLLEKNIRLPMQFSLSVVHCVCTALQFAYNQDMTLYGKVYDRLIHRDIKPANILLTTRGIVKLADFGIARPSEVSIHTVGSKVMGTFAYLSPEQLNGEKLDQRSDVYSLGTVLYEMLTGAKTFPQKLLAELVQRKSNGQFIPVGSMGVHLPHQLSSAVEKALAFDRIKRFCDAGEFNIELTAIIRRLTTKTPEEIIRTYLKNPYAPGLRRKPVIDIVPVVRSVGIVAIIVVFAFIAFRTASRFRYTFTQWKQYLIPPAVPSPPAAANQLPTLPSKTIIPQRNDQPPKASIPKHAPVDPLTAALKKFSSGDYAEAISALESISPDILSPPQKKLRVIRLLQAYISFGNIEEANNLAAGEPVDDGLFYLLKSQIAVQRNQLEIALEAADAALSTPSSYDKALRRKASFQKALVLHSRYFLKPNQTNFKSTREGWKAYVADYCSNDDHSKECHEALEKLSTLEQ